MIKEWCLAGICVFLALHSFALIWATTRLLRSVELLDETRRRSVGAGLTITIIESSLPSGSTRQPGETGEGR